MSERNNPLCALPWCRSWESRWATSSLARLNMGAQAVLHHLLMLAGASPQPEKRPRGARLICDPLNGRPLGMDALRSRMQVSRRNHIRDACFELSTAGLLAVGYFENGALQWRMGDEGLVTLALSGSPATGEALARLLGHGSDRGLDPGYDAGYDQGTVTLDPEGQRLVVARSVYPVASAPLWLVVPTFETLHGDHSTERSRASRSKAHATQSRVRVRTDQEQDTDQEPVADRVSNLHLDESSLKA